MLHEKSLDYQLALEFSSYLRECGMNAKVKISKYYDNSDLSYYYCVVLLYGGKNGVYVTIGTRAKSEVFVEVYCDDSKFKNNSVLLADPDAFNKAYKLLLNLCNEYITDRINGKYLDYLIPTATGE